MAIKQTKAQLEVELKQARERIAELENMPSNKKLASAIGESEEKFQALIENSKGIITLLSADGKILYTSPSITKIMGYDSEELIGKSYVQITHVEDTEKNNSTFLDVLAQPSKPVEVQTRYLHKSGEWRWVDVTATNLLSNPNVQAIVANYRDVTEERQIQEQLAKNETRYRNLFEEAEIALWEEDFSEVKNRINQLKKDGVKDIGEYLFSHPEFVKESAASVKMLDVNKATLKLFEAEKKEDLLLSLDKIIGLENIMVFADEMIALANGETSFLWEGNNWTLKGKKLYVKIHLAILEGYEDTLSRAIVSIVDITESKIAEEGLTISEERYRSMAEDMPAMLCRFKHDGTLTFINTFYCQYFNQSHDELIGSNLFLLVPAEERELVKEKYLSLNQEKPYITYEYKTYNSQGKECWQRWTDRALFNGHGEIIEFQSLGEDITERKQSEEALYKSEERFRTTFDQMMEGAQIIGFDWRYIYLNTAAEKHNRRPNSELLGEKYTDVWPKIESTYAFTMIKRCMEERIPCQMNNKFTYPDGTHRWFELSIQAIPEGVFILSIDITERKQIEDALYEQEFWLKESQRVGHIGSYVLDIEKDVWNSSTVLDDIFGIANDSEKTLKSWSALVVPEQQEEMMQYFKHNVLEKHEPFNKEYQIIRADDGQVRWVWGQGELIMDKDGNPFKMFGTIQDITERKQIEHKLQESKQFFQHALDALSAHIAILDETGIITAVNKSWRLFGQANGLILTNDGVGFNYLESCNIAAQEGTEEATSINDAIREMLTSNTLETQRAFEYPCHSPSEKRWFMAGLTKFEEQGKVRVVVSHENITERKLTGEKVERRVLELEALYQTGISFSQSLDEKDIGEKVIEVLSGSLEWHHAAVRVKRADSDYVELIASIHPHNDQDGSLKMQSAISRVGVGLTGWVIQHGKSLRINNLQEDSRYFKTFEGMKSGLYVPMRTHNRTIGCISAESDQLNAFTEEDEHLLITLATQAAIAIQNAESFEKTQNELTRRKQAEEKNLKQLERLTALHEIGQSIISTFDLELSLNTLLAQAVQILGVDASTVLLIKNHTLECKAQIGFRKHIPEAINIPIEQSYAGRAVLEQSSVQIPNLAEEPGNLFSSGFIKDEEFVSYYDVPLIAKGKVIGVLEVFNRSFVERDEDWLNYFETLAELAAIAIDNANLFSLSQYELAERRTAEEALRQSHAQLEQRVEERTIDLRKANLNLEHAMRIKDEFLASMSHELRTPLNAIIGLSESLGEQVAGPLNEKQQRYIQTIGESGHHLLELINDILDLAKIEAGYMELNISVIDVETLCQSSLRMINELAQKKSLQVLFNLDATVKKISGDERRLKQSLVNLLINAVKFTKTNGKIGLEVVANLNQQTINFTVWDEGIGIAKEDIPLLFQSFVQLEGGLAREYAGTGLGLSLVKQMITLHGGTVYVQSEKGKGSRFTISLPWANNGPDTERKIPKISATSPKVEEGSVGTLLLVEDTEEIIVLLDDYLTHLGHRLYTARNGAEGVALAIKLHPDIILMDIMMPVMDGLEATRNIRKETSLQNIPIIGLTALAMPGDQENCIEAGMTSYLSKPVELKKLSNLINNYLIGNGKNNE